MNFLQTLIHNGGPIVVLLMLASAASWYWILTIHMTLKKNEDFVRSILAQDHLSALRTHQTNIEELTGAVRIETAFLKSLAQTALFLGLLGTVIGILNSMQVVHVPGTISELFTQGIAHALFTTGAGICAALPAVFAVPIFRRRCDKISGLCQSAAAT